MSRIRASPIPIDHFPISLCLVWVGTAPISIGHSSCQFNLSQDHTYIDRPSSYQFSSTYRVFVQYDIKSHIFSLGVQSHCAYSSRHFESPIFLHFGRSKSFSSPGYLMLIACSSCSSRLTLQLHMTQCFEIMTNILAMLLGTLQLAFSCSSYKAVSFGHILSCTSEWFNRYSSLIWSFESLLEMS